MLDGLPPWALPEVRRVAGHQDGRGDVVEEACLAALETLDAAAAAASPLVHAAARSGIETAILDAWSKRLRMPLSAFLGFPREAGVPRDGVRSRASSYYTVALDDDVAAAVANARWGATYTRHLKLKIGRDATRTRALLRALADAGLIGEAGGSAGEDRRGRAGVEPGSRTVCLRCVLHTGPHTTAFAW